MRNQGIAIALGLASMVSTASAQTSAPAATATPRCRLSGEHFSGVVSVDLRNGSRADLPLVDVRATIDMAQELDESVVRVTSPLRFDATFVAGGRGGPGVYAARAFRAPDRSIALAANTPVEARLAASNDRVTVRAPLDWHNGYLEVDLPCTSLRAGAPRASMTAPRPVMRGEFVRFADEVALRARPSDEGARIGHLVRAGEGPLTMRGHIGRASQGFVRVTLHVGPLTVEGFVPEGSVSPAGRDLVPPGASINTLGVNASLDEAERETLNVTLPAETEVFADPLAPVPWAFVAAPLRSTLSRRVGSRQRYALVLSHASVPDYACRFDGVAGLPPCGESSALPALGVLQCSNGACTQVAYVEPPR